MSTFSRLSNLARGMFRVQSRRWDERDAEPESEAPRPVARPTPVSAPAEPPAPTPTERDEHGEVKRTL
jgi:hypothetical protein